MVAGSAAGRVRWCELTAGIGRPRRSSRWRRLRAPRPSLEAPSRFVSPHPLPPVSGRKPSFLPKLAASALVVVSSLGAPSWNRGAQVCSALGGWCLSAAYVWLRRVPVRFPARLYSVLALGCPCLLACRWVVALEPGREEKGFSFTAATSRRCADACAPTTTAGLSRDSTLPKFACYFCSVFFFMQVTPSCFDFPWARPKLLSRCARRDEAGVYGRLVL